MQGFKVYLNNHFYDEVFFRTALSADAVKSMLIAQENYPSNIVVKPFRN